MVKTNTGKQSDPETGQKKTQAQKKADIAPGAKKHAKTQPATKPSAGTAKTPSGRSMEMKKPKSAPATKTSPAKPKVSEKRAPAKKPPVPTGKMSTPGTSAKPAEETASAKPGVEIDVTVEPGAVAALARRAMPTMMRMLITILFLAVFAGLFTWYILLQWNTGEVEPTLEFIQGKPILAAYSYTVILLALCVVAAATWRPVLTIGAGFVFCSILMYINAQKVAYRAAPLVPEDFLMTDQAGTIMQFIDQGSVTQLVWGVILVLIGSLIADRGLRKIFGRETRGKAWWERHNLLPRVVWTLIALTGLMMFARPVLRYHDKSEDSDRSWIEGLEFSHWNQMTDFENNGFILAFLYNLGRFQEPEPDGYNEAAVRAIAKKYKSATEKSSAPELGKQVDNIIIVLNESFIDPEILGETYAHSGGDIVPELHKIFEKYPSGYMYSPIYGGGTANAEFEVLTSLSNYWAETTPYVTTITKLGSIPGIIGNARANGLTGTAIHPFEGMMYRRNTVYQQMGIETLLDEHSMENFELENGVGYASDKSAYNEVLRVLRDGAKKHVVMLPTMQNHAPYDAAKYNQLNFNVKNDLSNAGMLAYYLETVHSADKYLGEFVKELDKIKERTVMVWFGDHAPAVLNEYVESEDPKLVDKAHLTPYFVYANFDLKELYTEKEVEKMNAKRGFSFETDGVDLPVVTPNCLSSTLYDLLGAKKTPLIELTSRVCKESPILAPSYSQNDKVEMTELLKEYRLVNYDVLSGRGWWLGM